MAGCGSFRESRGAEGNRFGRVAIRTALVAVLLLSSTVAAALEPLRYYGFDEAAYSPMARDGMHEIFAGHLFEIGIPIAGARMMMAAQANGFCKEQGLTVGSPEAMFYGFGRLPSPETRAVGADAGFGIGESILERDGKQVMSINCFGCHSGVVNGTVVAGLGNNHINQSNPNRITTRGDNYGPYEVWRLGARLADPEKLGMVVSKERTELQAMIQSLALPPVDPMPWWNMKYKKLNYWYGDGGSHSPENFSINFTVPHAKMNENRAQHVETVAKALAFARETQSPVFPGSLNAELVAKGADLFHGRTKPAASGFTACKTCHGTYTKKESATDLTQPGGWAVEYDFSDTLRNVRTDEAYNSTLQKLRPVADNINKLAAYFEAQGTPELKPHATVPDKPGYVAPPLVGIWASAPYFHNGSVPTVEAVLNSAERPEIWARDAHNPHAYDLTKVGMAYKSLSRDEFVASAAAAEGKPFLSKAAIDHGAIYDTTAYGHGNSGHTFGDKLADDERAAVVEFLKSLSGPDM